MTESSASGNARRGLASVREVPYRVDRVPVTGPRRVVALSRLREVFARDLEATLDGLVTSGWAADDVVDAAHAYSSWAHAWLAQAIADGLDAWGRLP